MLRAVEVTYSPLFIVKKLCKTCNSKMRSGWKAEVVREDQFQLNREISYVCEDCADDVPTVEKLVLNPEEYRLYEHCGLCIGDIYEATNSW